MDMAQKSSSAAVVAVLASICVDKFQHATDSSSTLVEWYDFYAYAFTSIYFAPAFFPASDPTSQLLSTAGIFAVGFFMRPLGGWLFGWIADRHGRRPNANDFFNRWGDWSLGLKVAAPFGMLERGPC